MKTLVESLDLCDWNPTGHRWIPHTKVQLCGALMHFYVSVNRLLNKQSMCRWFDTPWLSRDVPLTTAGTLLMVATVEKKVNSMMSCNANAFRVTGPLWEESSGHRWIPLTKGQWCRTLMFLWCSSEQILEPTLGRPVIRGAMPLAWRRCNKLLYR